ncbi:hypothetical protein [Gordonia sp. MP11Mi]|uniref:Uncharacterized protein n=1 Tax=Gordonia sp. MP11Mi TaxID=3022769 RepID=A0AA97CY27_9ACTN
MSGLLPTAQERLAADLRLMRAASAICAVLLLWLVIGLFRHPASSWIERFVVGVLAFCVAAPVIGMMAFRKRLPALDRTPRPARVIGRDHFNTEPEPDSEIAPYVLVRVAFDVDGQEVEALIADLVVAPSLDEFVDGSVWQVYAFAAADTLTKTGDGWCRVILAEAHDGIVRAGYDLGAHAVHNEPGTGSDLLLRRFARR